MCAHMHCVCAHVHVCTRVCACVCEREGRRVRWPYGLALRPDGPTSGGARVLWEPRRRRARPGLSVVVSVQWELPALQTLRN